MVVQLFVTLALITSYVGQGVIVALLLRYPLEIILRFEWHFCGFALVCKGLTGKKRGEFHFIRHRPREIGRTWLWAELVKIARFQKHQSSRIVFQNYLAFLERIRKGSLSEFPEIYALGINLLILKTKNVSHVTCVMWVLVCGFSEKCHILFEWPQRVSIVI
jgi:hypothetical protein